MRDREGTDRRRRAERFLRGRLAGGRRRRRRRGRRQRPVIAPRATTAIVATRDHHIDPGAHFSDTPTSSTVGPRTAWSARRAREFHPAFDAPSPLQEVFSKGEYSAAYSGFEGVAARGTSLADWLRAPRASTPSTWSASPPITASGPPRSTRRSEGFAHHGPAPLHRRRVARHHRGRAGRARAAGVELVGQRRRPAI